MRRGYNHAKNVDIVALAVLQPCWSIEPDFKISVQVPPVLGTPASMSTVFPRFDLCAGEFGQLLRDQALLHTPLGAAIAMLKVDVDQAGLVRCIEIDAVPVKRQWIVIIYKAGSPVS